MENLGPGFFAFVLNLGVLSMLAWGSTIFGAFEKSLSPEPGHSQTASALTGVLFGVTAMLLMMMPTELTPGIIGDGRGGPILLSGIVGGPVAALITTTIAATTRYMIGGVGAAAGIVYILGFGLFSTLAYMLIRSRKTGFPGHGFLFLLATAATAVTMPVIFLLPEKAWYAAATTVWPLLYGWNIVGTILLGFLCRRETERAETTIRLGISEKQLTEANQSLEKRIDERTEQLVRSEAFARSILDSISAHIAVLDKDGNIIRANKAWIRFARENGLDWDDRPLPWNYLEIYDSSEGDFSDEADEMSRAIRDVIGGSRQDYSFEYPCHSPDTERWFLCRVLRLDQDDESRVIVTHDDVTQVHTARVALQLSENRLSQATQLAGLGYYIREGIFGPVIHCSDQHARHFGLSPDTYIQLANQQDSIRPPMIVDEDYALLDDAEQTLYDGRTIELEYRVQAVNGEIRHVRELIEPLMNFRNEVTQIMGTTQDVTESKESEARLVQSQKMEAVGQLTGGIAHDFNNLLAVIYGNAELLLEVGDQKNKRPLELIIKAAKRGADLTNQLLSFARRQPLRPRTVDINAICHEMTEMIQRTIGASIAIKSEFKDDACLAEVDPGQLENSVLNLAINARDAMPDGGELLVSTGRHIINDTHDLVVSEHLASGTYVSVTVADTGHGMSPEVRERVFEPFFTTKDVGEGSGLGLPMVYGFAQQSRGHVQISSSTGDGTSVTILLPEAETVETSPSQ